MESAASLLGSAGLVAEGPLPWGTAVDCDGAGVYVIETPQPLARAPIDDDVLRAWIARVPTIKVDGAPATVATLRRRLEAWWVPDEAVVYIGRRSGTVAKRLDDFYETPLGDPRPHAGGHWLKTLDNLSDHRVWFARCVDDEAAEAALLGAFAAWRRPGEPSLPFANREDAAKVRKPHGIAGSTLPRGVRRGVAAPRRRSAGLAEINAALQRMACASPDREVRAVEAAAELDRLGLLRDSGTRRGKPLRDLVRAGQIAHARQEGGRWWFIRCAGDEGRE